LSPRTVSSRPSVFFAKMLSVHPSGFYAWVKEPLSQRVLEDERQIKLVEKAWNDGGVVTEGFRDEILADIRTMDPDIVLLSMHGAMVAEGYDDCEGDLLARARAIVGPNAVIGLEIADGDADRAAGVAAEFGQTLWNLRDQLVHDWPAIEAALDHVENAPAHPIAPADFADNAGGGAPSDSSYFHEAILARGMKDVAIGMQ